MITSTVGIQEILCGKKHLKNKQKKRVSVLREDFEFSLNALDAIGMNHVDNFQQLNFVVIK